MRSPGCRVVQIPVEWPSRYGTVLEVSKDASPTALLIGWDDRRRDWIENKDLRALRVWFINEGAPARELTPGPLELQLARFLAESGAGRT